MKKSLFILFLFTVIATAFKAKADLTADWRLHLPFDEWPTQVVETPSRVYFMSRTFEENHSVPSRSVNSNALYYFDKQGEEIIPVNERIQASGNAVACINYNYEKKYLLVVYTDCNIDFFYEDGRVVNLPSLKVAAVPARKEANTITFDHEGNRAYIATNFGYVALNDVKHEVAESRNYGVNVESVVRSGDVVALCLDGKVLYAPASSQRFNIDDYAEVEEAPEIRRLIPTHVSKFYGYNTSWNTCFGSFTLTDEGELVWEKVYDDPKFFSVQEVRNGHRLTGNVRLFFIGNDGDEVWLMTRPETEYSKPAASFDGKNMWTLTARRGLRGMKRDSNDKWVVAYDHMRPNSPAVYVSSSLLYHPSYGMLAGSNGVDLALNDFNQATPANVSALRGNFWKEYGAPYSGNSDLERITNYMGLAVDPKNPGHLYRGSTLGGLMRINLAKPEEILVMANKANPFSGKQGFISVAPDLTTWNLLCRFTAPQFSADGTLWTLYNNRDMERAELWYWSAADRLATTSQATYRQMKSIPLPKFPSGNNDVMIHLQKNRNMVAVGGMADSGTLLFYDHNGTPDNTSDDRYVHMSRFYDQDGGTVDFLAVNALYEDPATGLVWIMTQRGLFTVNPQTAFEDPTKVNRIKVARNDGTNLADYLLNEINVNHLSADGEGRKWFSTSSGLVCTAADGRSILAEFTTENSPLPSNNVYATCFNPDNNSIMVATEGGLVEMFPSGSGGGQSAESGIRVYPNPVEPDYYGWVRIDNLADGSLVKITDSKGGIVKELGPARGGSVEWDVSGFNNSRVSSGVYYVMVSPGSSGDGKAQISKILVLN